MIEQYVCLVSINAINPSWIRVSILYFTAKSGIQGHTAVQRERYDSILIDTVENVWHAVYGVADFLFPSPTVE